MCEDEKYALGFPGDAPYASETGFLPGSCFEGNDFAEFFRLFLQSKNPKTAATYQSCVRAFSRFLAVSEPEEAGSSFLSRGAFAAKWMTMKYKAHLKARGFAPATVNLHLSAIRNSGSSVLDQWTRFLHASDGDPKPDHPSAPLRPCIANVRGVPVGCGGC